MQVVVADTGPLNYLIHIGRCEVLGALFTRVILPDIVLSELREGPQLVRSWLEAMPEWVEIRGLGKVAESVIINDYLDPGEEAAIRLAIEVGADLVLMDDRAGVHTARAHGLAVTGTWVYWRSQRVMDCSI